MTTIEAVSEVCSTPEGVLLGAKSQFSNNLYGCRLFRDIAKARLAHRYSAHLAGASLGACQPYVSTFGNRTFIGVQVCLDARDDIDRNIRIRFAKTISGQLTSEGALARDIAGIVRDGSPEVIKRNMQLLHVAWDTGYVAMCAELGGDVNAINSVFRRNAQSGLFEVRPLSDPYTPGER